MPIAVTTVPDREQIDADDGCTDRVTGRPELAVASTRCDMPYRSRLSGATAIAWSALRTWNVRVTGSAGFQDAVLARLGRRHDARPRARRP